MSKAKEAIKARLGVPGLDNILIGGLARSHLYLIEGSPGTGTTAEIWLPVQTEASRKTMSTATIPPRPKQDNRASRRLRILAVDDDGLVLMNTVAMLEDLGHEVKSANSGKLALELAAAYNPDLVVTDQAMPQMTGSQLSVELRLLKPGIPIILATGYSELPPGANSDLPRLSKPFSLTQLAAAVNQATAPEPVA